MVKIIFVRMMKLSVVVDELMFEGRLMWKIFE